MQLQTERKLQQAFKHWNRFMLLMWRLGLGAWINACPPIIGRIMVITHTGRKSGTRRRTPVNYAIVDEEIYCTAGFGERADWYRNIIANPSVEVWLPNGWWAGVAQEVTDAHARVPLLREVLLASGFAAYAAGIDPRTMSDEELDAATREYRLIRIHRTAALTGEGGPGDWAWVWPLAVMLLLPRALGRRRR